MRLALVVLAFSVSCLIPRLSRSRESFSGFSDGHGADQAQLASRGGDVVGHGVELTVDGAVYQIVLVDADDRQWGEWP